MLTREELIDLADWIVGQRFRLEDEDGADPVQDEHAMQAWRIVWNTVFGPTFQIELE